MGRVRKAAKAGLTHQVDGIDFEGPFMLLRVDGRQHKIDLRTQSRSLALADDRVRRNYVISPAAYGIHWPEIDEDLSIDGLIASTKKTHRKAK